MVLVEAELENIDPPLPLVVVGDVRVTPESVISTLDPEEAKMKPPFVPALVGFTVEDV